MRSKIADKILSETSEIDKQKVRDYANNLVKNRIEFLDKKYLELFKYLNGLEMALPNHHPKIKEVESEMANVSSELKELKKNNC